MAIAAGLPAPRVLLLDGPAANAAAVGSGPENATLIVSRPLLDAMDRDATQGVLANLVGSLGNGDLRIATSIIAVYQTFGATSALLKAPLSGDARGALWRLIRFGAFRRGRGDAAAQAETITRLLGRELTEFDTRAIDTEPPSGSIAPPPPGDFWKVLYIMPVPVFAGLVVLRSSDPALFQLALVGLLTGAAIWFWAYRRWVTYTAGRAAAITRAILFLPYFIAVVFPQFLMMIVGPFLLGPLLGWLWRTRRYLADATAVQLTRNPDAVAHGLLQLGEVGGGIPGGAWAAPLFVVGPEATEARRIAQLRSQAPEIQAIHHRMAALGSGHGVASPEHLRAATELAQQLARTQADEGNAAGNEHAFTGGLGSIGAFHPPLGERLARLRALGATVAGGAPKRFRGRLSGMPSVLGVPLIALIFVLMAIAAVLMVVVVVLMLAIALAAAAFLMLAVLGLARALFG
jgi:Zn-dependent protease with chaperone function